MKALSSLSVVLRAGGAASVSHDCLSTPRRAAPPQRDNRHLKMAYRSPRCSTCSFSFFDANSWTSSPIARGEVPTPACHLFYFKFSSAQSKYLSYVHPCEKWQEIWRPARQDGPENLTQCPELSC